MSNFSFAWDGPKPPPSEPLPPVERLVLSVRKYDDTKWYVIDRDRQNYYLKEGLVRYDQYEFYASKDEAIAKGRAAGYIVEDPYESS